MTVIHHDATQAAIKQEQHPCRLCGGQTEYKFNKTILGKYDVGYFKCQRCHSLQTEAPYWLEEAYSNHISNLDVGALQRNLHNFAYCYIFAKIFKIAKGLDYGSSDGLLCRFMRDQNFDYYAFDKYASLTYAQGFTPPQGTPLDLVTLFEVLEHLPNPSIDLESIFAYKADHYLFSTEIYENQGEDWWYLAAETGQHVFFYSAAALAMIGNSLKMHMIKIGSNYLIYNPASKDIQSHIHQAQFALEGWAFDALRPHVLSLPGVGVARDAATLASTSGEAKPLATTAPAPAPEIMKGGIKLSWNAKIK
jgi:hypothetical protein